ncbi:MAG: MgtC/SapB family protein [Gammaproteobacteria bacterium]|nr:MgtC/SapB family protein [Gammaproteobacteria bacterium]
MDPTLNTAQILPRIEWPYVEVLVRLALALSLGLLIGLERERRGKEAGLRTFGFVALLGALGGSLGQSYALLGLTLTGVLTIFLNLHAMRTEQGTELTTSAAMLVTCFAGILCGQGHRLTPAATMVMTTALLAWKQPLAGFSMGLSENELRSALLLAILAIVIYPALPAGAIGPWNLIEPRAAWLTVLLIAGIGFVNYILWKLYRTRGIEVAGFLGGLVNSSVTVSELAARVSETQGHLAQAAYRSILLSTAAMIIRNAGLLAILAPLAFIAALGAHVLMLLVSAAFIFASWRSQTQLTPGDIADVKLELPFSLWVALKYGLLFLVLHVVGVFAQKFLGDAGFYVVSLLGGLISSASAVAAAASLAAGGTLAPETAATGAVIASLTSVMVNLPFILRARHRPLTAKLAIAMLVIAIAGIAGAFAWPQVMHLLSERMAVHS